MGCFRHSFNTFTDNKFVKGRYEKKNKKKRLNNIQ